MSSEVKTPIINQFTIIANNPFSLLNTDVAQKELAESDKQILSKRIQDFIINNYFVLFEFKNLDDARNGLNKLRLFIVQKLNCKLNDVVLEISNRLSNPFGFLINWQVRELPDRLIFKFGSSDRPVSEDMLKTLFRNPPTDSRNIELDLRSAPDGFDDAHITSFVSSNPNIVSLKFRANEKLTINGIKQIANFGKQSLRSISLSKMCLNDHWLQTLSECPMLSSLHLSGCEGLTTAGFSYLPKLRLEELSLENVSGITQRAVPHFQALTTLTSLVFKDLKEFNLDQDFDLFEGMRKLKKLSLIGLNISDRFVEGITSCWILEQLDLSSCEKLTSSSLDSIGKLSRLTYVNLRDTRVPNKDSMKALREMKPELTIDYDDVAPCRLM